MWISFVVLLVFALEASLLIWFIRKLIHANKLGEGKRFSNRVLAFGFVGMGGLFVMIGLGTLIYSAYFIAVATQGAGKVVDMRSREGSQGLAPIFQYTDAMGKEYTIKSSLYSNPPLYKIGDEVKVLYMPENPQRARIDGFMHNWFLGLFFGGMGGLFLGAGAGVLFFQKRWSKPPPIPVN